MNCPKTRNIITGIVVVIIAFCISLFFVMVRLNKEIGDKFEGRKWAIPAIVYARPLELYPGLRLSANLFEEELSLDGYRQDQQVDASGGYRRDGNSLTLRTRKFRYPEGMEPSHYLCVTFAGEMVASITNPISGEAIPSVRIDPVRIGSFHPIKHEDRLVLSSEEIPILLKQTLIAVEDRNFYSHHGISLTGTLRALISNIKAGRPVQGGSTLTQQLVKNFFLTSEKSLRRKTKEALMALLLDARYDKEDILTAYLNEVFLGQDGDRAIHGFGLASQFYFRRNLKDLSIAQQATLVGMVKAPSSLDPRRFSKRCLARRKTVLQIMLEQHLISKEEFHLASDAPLTEVSPQIQRSGFNRFPAFLDEVKQQLESEYKEEDLESKGLSIFTTLNPLVQLQLEKSFSGKLSELATGYNQKNLQGAAVISSRESGEIEAIIGSRDVASQGFNRALNARRQIGSLIKPAVYLGAIQAGYPLNHLIDDKAITVNNDGKTWQPENYDHREHGRIPLYLTLAHSYNLATVRLGLELGVDKTVTTLHELGFSGQIPAYPSLFLGAITMSPIEVSQIYQTIASGGFFQPLRSIRAVLDNQGNLLTRYGLQVEQRFSPQHIFLLTHCLERVVSEGTASHLHLSPGLQVAGKTGTSNDLRDSWFAGFSGETLCVVWLGRDDNESTGLTGSSGALAAWGQIMSDIGITPLHIPEPEGIVWKHIDTRNWRKAGFFSSSKTTLPFIGTASQTAPVVPPDMQTELTDEEPRQQGTNSSTTSGFWGRLKQLIP